MNNAPTAAGEDCILASLERPSNYRLYYNIAKVKRIMKYFYTFLAILVIHSSWHFTASAQNVDFPDPNLAAAVRGALGLDATAPIPQTNLDTLANLFAGNAGITDLTGLESATGLTNVTLNGNQISDISPLADLTLLWNLVLNGNQISDISPLARLTVLFELNLNENPISDFEPLAGLTALTSLNLLGTGFSNSDFAHISPLVNLTSLDLSDNEISSLVGFGTFPSLTGMLLTDNRIRDLTPLTNLQNPSIMESLSLPNNQIRDISPLARFTGLTQLHLDRNQITDISPLANLINLEWRLRLNRNQITDISPLANLTKLIRLYIDRNQITDISPLENLTNLTTLHIHWNQITDISPLENLTNLTTLYFDRNQITDISPLENLTELQYLGICYNPYTDISPLENLTNLRYLYIDQVFVEANAELVAATTNATLIPCAPLPDPPPPVEGDGTEAVIEVPIVKNVKKRKPVSIYRSRVTQNPVIFNEILNAADDKNDWIELKNIADEEATLTDWELSIVNSEGENANKDVNLLTFRDYTLPAGGILLIVNTDPNETDLIRGQNIIDPESNPDAPPQYIIVPEMKLPDTPYMLILRNATNRKENGELKPLFEVPEAFEDLAGNYFRSFADYGTQVWPLINTWRPAPYHTALLTPGQAWQRIDVEKRGYTKEAWALSGHQSGLGYKPETSVETSLGTPGYPNDTVVDMDLVGRITFSELMYATGGGLFSPPQWIELYNNASMPAKPINLEGWKLAIEVRDSETRHRYSVLELKALHIATIQTALLVTRDRRHSGHLSENQVYDLYEHHSDVHKLGLRENAVLSASGFSLKLFSPDGTLVDSAGNLDGEKGRDTPAWELPSGWMEDGARTSLLRGYEDEVALDGTALTSWVRAADVDLPLAVYYGHKNDLGTPGYREGGVAPVMLSHFRSQRTDSGVIIEWSTASEVDNAGFNILRSETKSGRFAKVNPSLIVGAGTTSESHDYQWTDTTAKPNVSYYYRIEDVSFAGDRQQLATVRMRGLVSATGKLTTRWGDLKLQE